MENILEHSAKLIFGDRRLCVICVCFGYRIYGSIGEQKAWEFQSLYFQSFADLKKFGGTTLCSR